MKFGVVIFPGSNCDRDMIEAIENIGFNVVPLWHKDSDLSMFDTGDCIVLPGGFSYGDYLRCGAIARFSPMMKSVIDFANKGGRVIGICNGFQILCESGLLPGVLLANANRQFICKNVHIINTNDADATPLKIPIAHGEGRYFAAPEVLAELEQTGRIIYRYCNEKGNVHDDHNPNGTTNGIAGICNETRNVFGMMPHPERACSNVLGNTDGFKVFSDLLNIQIGEAVSV